MLRLRQYGKSAGIVDYKVNRNSGSLELSGYQEIGQGKVYCGQADRIFVCAVQRVDARLYFHRFLRIGKYVLAKSEYRKCLCVSHLLKNDDRTVFHGEQGKQCLLHISVALCDFCQIYNRRITEGTVCIL